MNAELTFYQLNSGQFKLGGVPNLKAKNCLDLKVCTIKNQLEGKLHNPANSNLEA